MIRLLNLMLHLMVMVLVELMNFLINLRMAHSWGTTKLQILVQFGLQFETLLHSVAVCSRLCLFLFYLYVWLKI